MLYSNTRRQLLYRGSQCLCATNIRVYRSGRILSLEAVGRGEISVPSPGPQHDERRLRFLHVFNTSVILH